MSAVAVALDFFPATVDLPNGTALNEARVLIANGRVMVYVNQGGTPLSYFDEPLLSSAGSAIRGFELQTESGIVEVQKARGCGCGNPLKSFNPFPGQSRTLVPM